MTNSYTDLDAKYDDDFRSGLMKIKPFILDLQKQENVHLCRMWLEKLIKSEPSERALRNIYLEELCRHVKKNDLAPPFDFSPTEGPLQAINIIPEYSTCKKETVELIETCTDNNKMLSQNVQSMPEEDGQSSESEEEECSAEQYGSSESLESGHCVSARVDSNTSYESIQDQLQNEVEETPVVNPSDTQSNKALLQELGELKGENKSLKEDIRIKDNIIHGLESERETLNEKIMVLNKNLENVNVELKQLQNFEKGYTQARKDVDLWIGKFQLSEDRCSKMESNYEKKIEEYETSTRDLKTEIEKLRRNAEDSIKPLEDLQLELDLSNKKREAAEKECSILTQMNEKLEKNIKQMNDKYEEKKNSHNKEIAQLKNRLQEECDRMKTEIKRMKETSMKDGDEVVHQLKSEISDYKLKLANITSEMNSKMRQYEAEIDSINKTKEMELCMQKMTLISQFSVTRQKELENIISVLAEKYQARLIASDPFTCESKEKPLPAPFEIGVEDEDKKENKLEVETNIQ